MSPRVYAADVLRKHAGNIREHARFNRLVATKQDLAKAGKIEALARDIAAIADELDPPPMPLLGGAS